MSHENHALSDVGQRSYVIFALDNSPDVAYRLQCLQRQGITAKAVQGGYTMESTGETVVETSYIIPTEQWAKVFASGFVDKQESVLVLGPKASRDAYRPAMLYFLSGPELPVFLGYFVDCAEHVAKAQAGWTEDDGVFYACFFDVEDASEE